MNLSILLGVALGVGSLSLAAPAMADDCDFSGWQSECDVSNSGSHVDISAGLNRPGSPPPRNDAAPPRSNAPAPGPVEPEECTGLCRDSYSVATVPDLTLADLASFRPARPSLSGEPAGFGVVGMPANLVATASEQTIPGTVLGWDVTVRFTPVAFAFDHGDGTSAVASTGGATWEDLGQAQFTPTATSHAYGRRGTYDVSVTVRYEASVDFGSGTWRPVPGYVTASAGGYAVEVVEVRTALVERTCRENPRGPGC
nr:hypothetical protein [Microbacterium sp. MF43]